MAPGYVTPAALVAQGRKTRQTDMARPGIDPDKRAAIVAALREGAGSVSRNGLAREHGVAPSTVSKIAKDEGLTDVFDRAAVKNATQARTVDMAEARSMVKARLLKVANSALDRTEGPYLVYSFGGADNSYHEHWLDKPPAVELRNLVTTAAIALDKNMAIEKHDSQEETGAAAVDTWLRSIMGGGSGS